MSHSQDKLTRTVVRDEAVARIERALDHRLTAVERIDIERIIEQAARDWPHKDDGYFW